MVSAADRLAQRHQRDIAAIAGGVTSVVAATALGADPMAVSTWYWSVVDSMLARIQVGYAQARQSGTSFLRRHAALSGHAGVDVVPGSLDVTRVRERLRITGPVAFKTSIAAGYDTDHATRSMAVGMSGVADECVRNGDRDVVQQTALHGSGVAGWRRMLVGRSCGFCSMLASRGAVYVSRDTAMVAADGMKYHPHCNCAAVPLYRHEQEPADVRRLQRQWDRITAGHHGQDKARAWARHWSKVEPRPRRSSAFDPVVQIRQSLASAQTPEQVAAAFRAEFRAITGRDVDASFTGSVATAREHAEGLLRTVQRYPATPLTRVEVGPLPFSRYAESRGGVVTFSDHWSSVEGRPRYMAALKADQRRGWHPYSTPDGVAAHEVTHVLDPDVPVESIVGRRPLPGYAARSEHEAVAEALADVVVNGQRASVLSREIAAAVDDAYRAGRYAGRRPRLARPGPPSRLSPPARGGPQARAAEAELQRLTVPQLKAMAAARGVAVPASMRKDALVRLVSDLESGVPGPVALGRASAADRLATAHLRAGASSDPSTWRAESIDAFAGSDAEALSAVTSYVRQPGFVNTRLRTPVPDPDPRQWRTWLHEPSIDEMLGRVPFDEAAEAAARARADRMVAALDKVMGTSRTPGAMTVYRGIDPTDIGLPAPGRAVGHTWTDAGFVSTATDRSVAHGSFGGGVGRATLEVRVPAGTPALRIDGLGETEVLLGRGLTFRVVEDVQTATGRRLVVEVVPSGRAAAKKAAPRLRESVLGGPMEPEEALLHALTPAQVARVAEELNIPAPIAHTERAQGGTRRWPADRAARIRYLLRSLDDGRRRGGLRAHGRDSIADAVARVTAATPAKAAAKKAAPAKKVAGAADVRKTEVGPGRYRYEIRQGDREAGSVVLGDSDMAYLSSVPDDALGIFDLKVPVAARGRGNAEQLMERVLADADAQGRPVALWAFADDAVDQSRLEAFYRRLGFVDTGFDPGGIRPSVVMVRPVGAAPLPRAAVKAAKKVAPKPPPSPEKMTGPALRKELETAGVTLPAKVGKPDLQRWVTQLRADRDAALAQIRRDIAKASGRPSSVAPSLREIIDNPDQAAARQAMRDGIEGTYAGIRVEVDGVRHYKDGSISVTGDLFDSSGRRVGTFEREIQVADDGSLSAYHEFLSIDRRLQGSGFAEEFNANLYDWYRRSGVTEVRLTANIDVGGYAWASKGFDFYDAAAAREFLDEATDKISQQLAHFERTGRLPKGLTEEDLRTLGAYVEDMRLDRRPAHAPEIARFGRRPGQGGKTATWAGKWLMLGSSWRGRIPL